MGKIPKAVMIPLLQRSLFVKFTGTLKAEGRFDIKGKPAQQEAYGAMNVVNFLGTLQCQVA